MACRIEADRHPISEGVYRSGGRDESLTVGSSEIRFQIRRGDPQETERLDQTYQYTVRPDGEVIAFPQRSVEMLTGVARFDWYWDGKSIQQKDIKNRLPDKIYTLEQR